MPIKMNPMEWCTRIEINPKILDGKPIFKGTRIPIYIILQMLRGGASFEKIIEEYPRLSVDDIRAALDYSVYLINQPDEEIIALN
jgi:uncharacterized protein (DUF433 family)